MMHPDASVGLLLLITHILLQGSGIGHSALHWCAAKGYLECLQWLLKQGADINTLNAEDSTLLHAAAANGQESTVQYLLDQPEIYVSSPDMHNHLQCFCMQLEHTSTTSTEPHQGQGL